MMSNMYSLLNYIAATSKEIYESSNNNQMLGNPLYAAPDRFTLQSVETGLRGLSEDEKRLVGISTISVVTRLALEFDMEEVSGLFIVCIQPRTHSNLFRLQDSRYQCCFNACAQLNPPWKLPLPIIWSTLHYLLQKAHLQI